MPTVCHALPPTRSPGELVVFSGSWDGRPFRLQMRPLGARHLFQCTPRSSPPLLLTASTRFMIWHSKGANA